MDHPSLHGGTASSPQAESAEARKRSMVGSVCVRRCNARSAVGNDPMPHTPTPDCPSRNVITSWKPTSVLWKSGFLLRGKLSQFRSQTPGRSPGCRIGRGSAAGEHRRPVGRSSVASGECTGARDLSRPQSEVAGAAGTAFWAMREHSSGISMLRSRPRPLSVCRGWSVARALVWERDQKVGEREL